MTAVLATIAVQDHGSEPRSRVELRPSPRRCWPARLRRKQTLVQHPATSGELARWQGCGAFDARLVAEHELLRRSLGWLGFSGAKRLLSASPE